MSFDLQLTVRSAAMFSTWVFCPTDHLCFDAGDGLVASLNHKLIAIQTMLVSHGHRDHVAGLPMFMNVRLHHEGPVRVVYPAGSGIMPDLIRFCERFEQRCTPQRVAWTPVRPGQDLPGTKKNLFIRPFATKHYRRDDGRGQSLGYHLGVKKNKVRPEFAGMSTNDTLDRIRQIGAEALARDWAAHPEWHGLDTKARADLMVSLGRAALTMEVEELYLSYSGDTETLSPETFRGVKTLVHEATFLSQEDLEDDESDEARYHCHSALPDVIEMAMAAGVEHLALFHISVRYQANEVLEGMKSCLEHYRPPFPVSIALPGRLTMDWLDKRIWPEQTA